MIATLDLAGARAIYRAMENAISPPSARSTSRREPRVDVLRGIALFCIYVDHVPADALNWLTLRNFGFCDAAEVFVLCAGFAAMHAYGRSFQRDGVGAGLRRIILRCLQLYAFQVAMLLLTYAIVWAFSTRYNLVPRSFAALMDGGAAGIRRGMTLTSQPSNLNILPLYIVLLAMFPVLYAGIRRAPTVTVIASAALWIAAFTNPELNLPNFLYDEKWFFNPFAWQFLFTLGMLLAVSMNRRGGVVPRQPWLLGVCVAFLVFGLLEAFPWQAWDLPNLAPLALETPDKSDLAPIRLLHVLALVYVVLTSDWMMVARRRGPLRWIEVCGRHSLEVFSLGTILALFARLAMRQYGRGLEMQLVVNVVGFAAMIGLAMTLDRWRRARRDRREADLATVGEAVVT